MNNGQRHQPPTLVEDTQLPREASHTSFLTSCATSKRFGSISHCLHPRALLYVKAGLVITLHLTELSFYFAYV